MEFLGLDWYWQVILIVVFIISIPFKIKFMKWWNKRQNSNPKKTKNKWGDDEE